METQTNNIHIMKRALQQLLSISFALTLFTQLSFAQTCLVVKDSITSGNYATTYQIYTYDLQNRMVKVVRVDSGNIFNNYDTLIYGGNGMVSTVEHRDGNDNVRGTTALTYNGSNQITLIVLSGDWGNGPSSMTHTVSYSGGNITSIILTDTTGQPEGFPGNFNNIVYTGGNMTSLNLVMEMDTIPGLDTMELTATYDNMNSLEAMLYIREAPDLIGFYSANNILQITLDNNEVLDTISYPAGTNVLQSTYTYNLDNNVETITILPGLFDDITRTTQYYYDCSVGMEEQVEAVVDVYPNPFTNAIQVSLNELDGQSFDLVLVNILGVEVLNERYSGVSSVNIEGLDELNSGLYFLQIKYWDSTITKKLVKE